MYVQKVLFYTTDGFVRGHRGQLEPDCARRRDRLQRPSRLRAGLHATVDSRRMKHAAALRRGTPRGTTAACVVPVDDRRGARAAARAEHRRLHLGYLHVPYQRGILRRGACCPNTWIHGFTKFSMATGHTTKFSNDTWATLDADGSGDVDYAEFEAYMRSYGLELTYA
jgi:hypothetical protein